MVKFSRWRFPVALLVLACFVALFCLYGPDWIVPRKIALASQVSANFPHPGVGGRLVVFCLIFVLTAAFGRWYCAVLCPAGTVQDLFSRLGRMTRLSQLSFTRPEFGMNILMLITAILFTGVILLDPVALFGGFALLPGGLVNHGAWGLDRLYASAALALGLWMYVVVLLAFIPVFFGRVYCDSLCPVGTVLRLLAKLPGKRLALAADNCVACGRCEKVCPVRCVDGTKKTLDGARCVLCLECVNACRAGAIVYAQSGTAAATPAAGRRGFLGGVGLGVLGAGYVMARRVKEHFGVGGWNAERVAPPGSGGLARHGQRCIGCQACVLACPVGIIRTDDRDVRPTLDYRFGYCQYNCVDCIASCPAGVFDAIGVEEKQQTRLARVALEDERCVVRTRGEECGACAEVCPTHAVTMVSQGEGKPTVPDFQPEYCIGCGACYHVCPVEPRAFVVEGLDAHEVSAGVRLVEEAPHGESGAPDVLDDFPF